MMIRACAGLAMLGALLPAAAVPGAAAARAGEELSDRGRKAQAVELDGPALAGNPEALARQLRAVGLRLVCLRHAFVPRFEGAASAREVVTRVAKESELEIAWLDGGAVAVLSRSAGEEARKALKENLASKDPLVWCPAVREAAETADLEIHRLLLDQAAADGERAAELARALAELDRLGVVLLLNEPRGLALAQRALAEKSPETRKKVVAALVEYGGPEAARLIGKVMEVSKPGVAEELDLFGAIADVGGAEAVKVLGRLVGHKALAGRAVACLGEVGGPEAARALEKALENEELVGPALAALAEIGGSTAVKVLAKALADPKVGAQAVEPLANLGGAEARDALIGHLNVEKGDLGFRQEMERILREKYPGDPKAKEALKKAEELDKQLEGGVEEGQAAPGAAGPAPAVEF